MKNFFGIAVLSLVLVVPAGASVSLSAQTRTATVVELADEILAADRAFSAAASSVDTLTGISAMFHQDVIVPLPGGTFARGKSAAVEALRTNPFNTASRAQWTPIRAGVSADGQHGFSLGYMTITGNDGTIRLAKYLTYWLRTPQGWRAGAYKRMPRPEGDVSLDVMAPSLPVRSVPAEADEATLTNHRRSLIAAEQAFSDEAQRIGIGPAFRRNGRDDAVNVGGEASFAVGAETISGFVGDGSATSPVHWGADDALVASSGDLGITFGVIRPNGPPREGQSAASAFFTIWRRDSNSDRWLYVAE